VIPYEQAPVISENPDEPEEAAVVVPTTWSRFWARFRTDRVGVAALVIVLLIVAAAVVGPLVYRQSPSSFDLLNPQLDAFPSGGHLLGTDRLGRDILARLLEGLRVSLGVVVLVETINVGLGLTVGLLAGYHGGWIDTVLSRLADLLIAFPGLLLAFLVAGVFGPSLGQAYGGLGRLALVAGSLALVSWPLMARYVRAEALTLRVREFVEAARALGVSDRWIILRHIMPNVLGLVLTAATLDMASVAVNEAVLSLLGLGVQPPGSSIGLMINDAIPVLDVNWTESLFPGVALTLLVLAFSFLGDGLRDAFDVRGDR
jgi:oligopeptide transport system permease protein